MTIAQQLNITEFPFDIKNEQGKLIYTELRKGYWCKWEYEKDGKLIYIEDSDGYILDKRPKPKPEPVKNQTAVEWLENQLKERYSLMNSEPLFDHAKAMEKEQIEDAWDKRCSHGVVSQTWHIETKNGEQYYNETYK
jgi:hypothetical protein